MRTATPLEPKDLFRDFTKTVCAASVRMRADRQRGRDVFWKGSRPGRLKGLLAVWLLTAFLFSAAPAFPATAEASQTDATDAPKADAYDEAHPEVLTADDLRGETAIVIDGGTGRVLFEKNADEALYPASTTKIMTCLLALENGDLDKIITVPKEITKLPSDSSLVPLKAGEKMSLRDLLYGLMLPSGNDAAVTIAVAIAGSVDDFVAMMNFRARELGCRNTRFENPHGYQDKDHKTSARDLALIAREAMKNATFREIVSAGSYTIEATNKSKSRKLTSTDLMLSEKSTYYYAYETGIKTGHHAKAGHCFVGAAEKDGVELISVTLKSGENSKWTDTKRLMEYGFSQYTTYAFDDLYAENPLYASIQSADPGDPEGGRVRLSIAPGGAIGGYSVSCPKDGFDDASKDLMARASIQYTTALTAPIRAGDILGSISLAVGDGSELTGTLIASRDVAAATIPAQANEQTASPAALGRKDEKPTSSAVRSQTAGATGAGNLKFLWIPLGILAVMMLLIVVLRARRAARRRKRALQRRRQQMAYLRARSTR